MHRWKQFIKGPGLHDELNSISNSNQNFDTVGPSSSAAQNECTDGSKVKEIYEKIVNEPSTSSLAKPSLSETTPIPEDEAKIKPPPRKLRFTQLMNLCETNNIEDLSNYIEYYESELDINEVDQYGWTLLMSAACSGSVDCVEFLLRAGSDWTLTDKSGFTAFHLAQKKHRTSVCELIGNWVKFRQSEEENGESSSESCDESTSDPKFCEACRVNFTNEKEHSKSIAHLVSTSTYSDTDKVHYGIPESNKGFQLMLKTGWDRRGLGTSGEGQKFPVKTVLKRDRKGLGEARDKKQAKITHFAPFDTAAVERQQPDQRLERVGTVKKKEEEKRRNKQRSKEIHYRRELGSI